MANDPDISLYSEEIAACLHRSLARTTRLLGVFLSNMMPAFSNATEACVVNTAPSKHPGLHWVAYFRDKGKQIEFFDSVGFAPEDYGLPPARRVSHDTIQALDSHVCGQYCVFYLCARSHGLSPTQVLGMLKAVPVLKRELFLVDFCKSLLTKCKCTNKIQRCTCPNLFCTHCQ